MRLPESFLFGALVGAHQVEGEDFNSDWWRWEQRSSRIQDGTTSERGAGHLKRYAQDFKLARKLGHNAVCISLSWPRVHAEEDLFDAAASTHYAKVFETAMDNGLAPLCILHHAALPLWLEKRGGWNAPEAPALFARYAGHMAGVLRPWQPHFIPIHEPEIYLTLVHDEQRWPGARGGSCRQAFRHLAKAHIQAARAVKGACPDAAVGLSVRGVTASPLDRHSPWDTRAAMTAQRRFNLRFLEQTAREAGPDSDPTEFIALSYFGALRVRFAPTRWRAGFLLPVTEQGSPAGMDDAREDVHGFGEMLSLFAGMNKPLYLTGLGLNQGDDPARCRFLQQHMELLLRFLSDAEQKADIRGLFHASLLDGFEFHRGYAHRTGLIHVRYPGLERTPNPSAWLFKDMAEHGRVRPEALRKYGLSEATTEEN